MLLKVLSWITSIVGLGCACTAWALYIKFPIMWAAIMSFKASAAQALMVLQLAMFVDWGGKREMID